MKGCLANQCNKRLYKSYRLNATQRSVPQHNSNRDGGTCRVLYFVFFRQFIFTLSLFSTVNPFVINLCNGQTSNFYAQTMYGRLIDFFVDFWCDVIAIFIPFPLYRLWVFKHDMIINVCLLMLDCDQSRGNHIVDLFCHAISVEVCWYVIQIMVLLSIYCIKLWVN